MMNPSFKLHENPNVSRHITLTAHRQYPNSKETFQLTFRGTDDNGCVLTWDNPDNVLVRGEQCEVTNRRCTFIEWHDDNKMFEFEVYFPGDNNQRFVIYFDDNTTDDAVVYGIVLTLVSMMQRAHRFEGPLQKEDLMTILSGGNIGPDYTPANDHQAMRLSVVLR